MATSNVIGKVQIASGDVKIVGVDGVLRDAVYDDYIYEGEKIVSEDPQAVFQIKYLELPESEVHSGIFSIMADGSDVIPADELATEEGADDLETAAGEEGVEANSQNIEENPEAIDYLQTFGRGDNDAVPFSGIPSVDEEEFGAGVAAAAEEEDINTPPNIEDGQSYNVNETLNVVGQVVASDADAGDVLTYSLDNDYGIFDITNNGLIFIQNGKSLDYEDGASYTLNVTVTDQNGASDTQSVVVNVNDITATVVSGEDVTLVSHTFDGPNNEGWTGDGNESGSHLGIGTTPLDKLGWFSQDSDTRSQTFDLSDQAGEEVNISFNLGVHGATPGSNPGDGWEGDDTFKVEVFDSDGDSIYTETYSPDGNYTDVGDNLLSKDFNLTVPEDGEVTVTFTSLNTENQGGYTESWMIDDFKIIDQDNDQILNFDVSHDGTIDVVDLVDQNNDYVGENPDSVDVIDLSVGNHNLSNITLEDVINITDGDNVLKITGDSGDAVYDIAANGWILDSSPTVTETGYETYTNIADSSVQLLIDIDIPIDVD